LMRASTLNPQTCFPVRPFFAPALQSHQMQVDDGLMTRMLAALKKTAKGYTSFGDVQGWIQRGQSSRGEKTLDIFIPKVIDKNQNRYALRVSLSQKYKTILESQETSSGRLNPIPDEILVPAIEHLMEELVSNIEKNRQKELGWAGFPKVFEMR
jgi:hypothetical protein